MPNGPDINDRFPLRESLSPPIIKPPVFECAEAVYVTGFMAHAKVRIFSGLNDLLAEEEPPFGFATITLRRSVAAGESLTATQEVSGQGSGHSLQPVIVQPLDGNRIRNTKPDVVEPLFECGRVVPVGNLVPSTRLHVAQDGAEIGQAAVANIFHSVVTQPLNAGSQVTAFLVACEGIGHEIKGPVSDAASPPPFPAPVPIPAPMVDAASLIPGNDVVTLMGLLVGAGIEIFDQGVLVCSGWLANAGANVFPVSQRLSGTPITATQELCGRLSPPSDPVIPSARLEAPLVLGPICAGARYVVVRNSTINATVVILRDGSPMTHGGAAPGDLVLQLGQNATLPAGARIEALQYMDGNVSPLSPPVIVTSGLAEPSIEILGGELFFRAKANEDPIPGPVFPRGRGPGPEIRIQSCCTREVRAWITGPRGERVADLTLDPLYPGYFQAVWQWISDAGWAVPDGIPVGEYAVHVFSACQEREARAPFFVVFNPASVAGPPRYSFDDTAIWFFSPPQNATRGLHYYLHCSDWRVFRIAIQAAAGHTVPYQAAISVARAEEGLFAYSLNYHTNDVVELITKFSDAQCADDAACLTALLRAVGIPAHPVTADAALETGAANWTFDTWVEFLADHAGNTTWRIFHPHEYPNMQPEDRGVFGLRGVANKGFNDVVLMANESWVSAEIDDGTNDVVYGRNACGEPNEIINKASWIDELCELGYWAQQHWDCTGVRRRSLVAGDGFRFNDGTLRFGGRVAGTVHLTNPMDDRRFGRLIVELVAHRPESKAFTEVTFAAVDLPTALDPNDPISLPFNFALPETLAPGRDLYLRARLDERTALVQPVLLASPLTAAVDVSRIWQEGVQGTIRILVGNAGDSVIRGIAVAVEAPFAVELGRQSAFQLETLSPREEREILLVVRAVAPLASGSLHIAVASTNAGGLMLRLPFRVEAIKPPLEAHPGVKVPN